MLEAGKDLLAVFMSRAFTWSGVILGCSCSINAAAPLTTGVAMLVPLISVYNDGEPGIPPYSEGDAWLPGNSVSKVLPGTRSETIALPGATRSGLTMRSPADGPLELKLVIRSSPRTDVWFVFIAPTVMTHGSLPGAAMVP